MLVLNKADGDRVTLRLTVSALVLQTSVLFVVDLPPHFLLFSSPFFFFVVILLFKAAPKPSAEVLFSVPKCKKAIVCLAEKICVLGKLCQTGVTALSASSPLMNQ